MSERIGTPMSPFEDGVSKLIEESIKQRVHQEMGPSAEEIARGMGLRHEIGMYLLDLLFDPSHEASSSSQAEESGEDPISYAS